LVGFNYLCFLFFKVNKQLAQTDAGVLKVTEYRVAAMTENPANLSTRMAMIEMPKPCRGWFLGTFFKTGRAPVSLFR
jgi:hypothetical protein